MLHTIQDISVHSYRLSRTYTCTCSEYRLFRTDLVSVTIIQDLPCQCFIQFRTYQFIVTDYLGLTCSVLQLFRTFLFSVTIIQDLPGQCYNCSRLTWSVLQLFRTYLVSVTIIQDLPGQCYTQLFPGLHLPRIPV